ncbi:MAG TPA: hypothetical protein VKA53_00145, partial [Thermoanaerobaculia bacterium]|nr:hypothetical protein [Thermoanaerobaculia bacterium]
MKTKTLIAWLAVGVVAALALATALPRALPFQHRPWTISSREAVAVALERFRDLGKPVTDPYIVSGPDSDQELELRLDRALPTVGREELVASPLAREVTSYLVTVYPTRAAASEWTYRARFSFDGRLLALQTRVPADAPGNLLPASAAKAQAARFLRQEGLDLAQFEAPEVRTHQLQARTDTTLRYLYRDQVLGGGFSYGVEVSFAGERLTGFRSFHDDPHGGEIKAALQPALVLNFLHVLAVFILLIIVAVPFLRRYHAGEIGVRHGLHIMVVVFLAGALLVALSARGITQGVQAGIASPRLMSWLVGLQMTVLFFLPISLLAFLSWSVGESRCRERWSDKLAAFDGLFTRQWKNGTVARSALRGSVLGLSIAALIVGSTLALKPLGVWPLTSFAAWWPSASWMGLALLCFGVVFVIHSELFGRLFLLPWAVDRFGKWAGGAMVALI